MCGGGKSSADEILFLQNYVYILGSRSYVITSCLSLTIKIMKIKIENTIYINEHNFSKTL